MQINKAEHLPKDKQIQLGSYYTPTELTKKVFDFIQPYISAHKKEAVIFDSAGGCGAFLVHVNGNDYRIADKDTEACAFLKRRFDKDKIFHTNSLIEVNRGKYAIPSSAFLIMVGNPPYNDTTSEFKNGRKGKNICDENLYDRDLGVSFLKSYYKLNADIVCVLHPLSYLIKEANFKRLRVFKDSYKLVKGEIFSSALFHGTGLIKFPILIALYEENLWGMTFNYIKQFQFDVLGNNKKFILSNYKTTDGYIDKYPPRKYDIKKSPIGLYYYTFRDFNSLKKNASFFTKEHPNGIVVTVENFYNYAYLHSLKSLFKPENAWLYGNLSPLVNIEGLEKDKKLYVLYALKTHPIFKEREGLVKKIADFYKIDSNDFKDVNKTENKIKDRLSRLIKD
jgi:hypothetical protein